MSVERAAAEISEPASERTAGDGQALRERAEALGGHLAEALNLVVAGIPGRPNGPRALGRELGLTTVTASRVLTAIAQSDPLAVLQALPGPNPLHKMVAAARERGCPADECEKASLAVDVFDELIRSEAGDRGSLKAMLSAWLPDERREFEAQRRQTMFKALGELEGVSCDLELSAVFVAPSQVEGRLDLANAKCLLGIDRIRPDAVVKLGTRRLSTERGEADSARVPLTLDGDRATDGLHTVRLDDFCDAPPAPFVAAEFGDYVQYSLGPTGLGRGSKVDVVIAELNRAELPARVDPSPRYFFMTPEMATRKAVMDVFVHEDTFGDRTPEFSVYDTTSLGVAVPGDPARALDERPTPVELLALASAARAARLVEFPRYTALVSHVAERLDWDLDRFRLFRVAVPYPLVGHQLTLAF